MASELPARNERDQHQIKQDEHWSDKARLEAGFLGSSMRGFKKAAVASFDADHWLGTTSKLALSFGVGLAMARLAPARGALGLLARAGGSAMGLSFVSQLLTTGKEAISGRLGNSAQLGDFAGQFAFDNLLMTASGIGGQRIGSRAFKIKRSTIGENFIASTDFRSKGTSPAEPGRLSSNGNRRSAHPTWRDIRDRTRPGDVAHISGDAIVQVHCDGQGGTGFFTSHDGKMMVVTALHVIANNTYARLLVPIQLRTVRGDVLQAELAAASVKRDLAVLNVVSDLPKTAVPLTISRSNVLPGESRNIGIHQAILSSGQVLTEDIGTVGAATAGEGYRFHSRPKGFLNIGSRGMSGGPIVDSKGDVVSIICAGHSIGQVRLGGPDGPNARTIRALLRSADTSPSRALRLWPGAADSDEISRIAGSVLSDRYSQMSDLHLLEIQERVDINGLRQVLERFSSVWIDFDSRSVHYWADLRNPITNSHDFFDHVDDLKKCKKFPIREQVRSRDVNVVAAREYPPLYSIRLSDQLNAWHDIHSILAPGGEVVVFPWRMNSQPPKLKQYLKESFDIEDRRPLPNCLGHELWVFRKKPE